MLLLLHAIDAATAAADAVAAAAVVAVADAADADAAVAAASAAAAGAAAAVFLFGERVSAESAPTSQLLSCVQQRLDFFSRSN